jgi:hypothetical protein
LIRWPESRSRIRAARAARGTAVVVLQLMKAASVLSDEKGLPGREASLRDLEALAVHYLEQRLHPWAG